MAEDVRSNFFVFFLSFLCGFILLLTIKDVYFLFFDVDSLDHVSGAWINLANDLRNGIFYRPLQSEIGYGGTRFFPLQFVLHAFLMNIFSSPFVSGAFATTIAGTLYLFGMFFWLRRVGVSIFYCLVFTLLPLGLISFKIALGSMRGDLLAAALTLFGLGFFSNKTKASFALATVFFSLAFATKVTSIHGPVACLLYLLFNGKRRDFFTLLTMISIGISVSVATIAFFSEGRIFEIMKICSSGGASFPTLVKGPINMFHQLITGSGAGVPSFLFCFIVMVLFFSVSPSERRSLPMVFFAVTLFLTFFIFGSPGTVLNHVIDLDIAAVSVLAVHICVQNRKEIHPEIVITFLALLTIAMPVISKNSLSRFIYTHYPDKPYNSLLNEVSDTISPTRLEDFRPILSENPVIPLFTGDSVFLQDPFMFARLVQSRPEEEARLAGMISRHAFRAIILMKDPETVNESWYRQHFGMPIMRTILSCYNRTKVVGGKHFIYLPKQ